MSNASDRLVIDHNHAIAHLTALGYQPGDRIYLRKFPPQGVQGSSKMMECTFDALPKFQAPDGGLYFCVNSGGQLDKEIDLFRAIFFEFDDRPVDEQLDIWKEKGLPEPTLQVKTRKSIHTYYSFSDSEGVTAEGWKDLQEDLLELVDGDRTLKNASRVMRLSGAWHIKKDEPPVKCEIVANSGKFYKFAELRNAIKPRYKHSTPEWNGHTLSDFLQQDVLPRLSHGQQFNWSGHNWQGDRTGKKIRGSCPWHESQSGTAFYTDLKSGVWLWRCPSCEMGGTVVEYRHLLKGGRGVPKGKDFVEIVKELASDAGLNLPEFQRSQEQTAKSKSDFDNHVPLSYNEALDQVELLEQAITDDGELHWATQHFAVENGLHSKGFSGYKLLQFARARKDGRQAVEVIDAHDIMDEYQKPDFLISGNLLKGVAVAIAAAGGSGKTSLCYDWAKNIALGTPWSGYKTQQGRSLIVQTDEPKANIAQKLRIAKFRQVPRGMVEFITKWRFSQFRQLERMIREGGFSFCVIDSWTAAHAGLGIDLTKSNAGDNAYLLRDLAEDTGCVIVVIHHLNKTGDFRDSSTLKDNVSEAWRMYEGKREDGILPHHRILHIEKSRADLKGHYLLEQNAIDYSWKHLGPLEAPDNFDDLPLIARIQEYMQSSQGDRVSPAQIAREFDCEYSKAEMELQRLFRHGVLDCEHVVRRDGERSSSYFEYFYAGDGTQPPLMVPQIAMANNGLIEEDF